VRAVQGTIAAFDAHRGLGEIAGDDGNRYPFHCTVITDGSRTIGVGTTVAFEVVAGLAGRWEATDVHPV
jgi:cold shock CspA family protein